MDVGAISFTEIEAWARLKRIELLPFEVDAIRAVDKAFVKQCKTERRDHNV